MSDILQELACPNCLSPIDIREHGEQITCPACSSKFLLAGHICPDCTTYHKEERPFCRKCGAAMMRVCRKCRTRNWTGDEYCKECGSAMDIFDILAMQNKETSEKIALERREKLKQLKEEEERASQRRMAAMMEADNQRRAEIRARREQQRQNDKQIMAAIAGGVGIILLIIVFILVL